MISKCHLNLVVVNVLKAKIKRFANKEKRQGSKDYDTNTSPKKDYATYGFECHLCVLIKG